MKRKTILLVVAALSALAFTALPSMASAFESTPSIDLLGGAEFPAAYSGENETKGTLYTASGRNFTCTGSTIAGQFTDSMTGSVKVHFHGCRENKLNSTCYSPGNSSGEITTTTLETHTVYLGNGQAGVVFTPNAGHFATIECLSGFVKIVVRGSEAEGVDGGVLGAVTAPEIGGVPSSETTIDVSATSEEQEYTETEEGTKFGIESNLNGGAFEPAYEDANPITVTLTKGEAKTTE